MEHHREITKFKKALGVVLLILLILAILTGTCNAQKKKYYRVVEYFKPEGRKIYFDWGLDSAEIFKIKANTSQYGVGAIINVEGKTMSPEKAQRKNKRKNKRIERENYPNIKNII